MSERRRNTPRFASAGKQLTRYASAKERPLSSSQLTRYTQEYSRDADLEGPVAHPAANQRIELETPVKPRVVPKPQQPLPKTEVVQPQEKQLVRSTQADLYSDAPITISVLKRALPQRFAQAKASNTVGFDAAAHKKNSQLGLTHAIRPLRSLFPHNPT